MYLSKMLNVLLQVLSYTLLADPYLLASRRYSELRRNIEKSYSTVYKCRADQVWVVVVVVEEGGEDGFTTTATAAAAATTTTAAATTTTTTGSYLMYMYSRHSLITLPSFLPSFPLPSPSLLGGGTAIPDCIDRVHRLQSHQVRGHQPTIVCYPCPL